jgi:hypothetical protein
VPQRRRLVAVVIGDSPATWRAAGFTVGGDLVAVGGVHIRLAGGTASPGILAWSFEPPWPEPIDGLPIAPPAAGVPPADVPDTHPNGVTAIDHVVVASPHVERTTAALAEASIEPRRTIVGARGDADVLYRFFLLGTCLLELIGPATAREDGPARFAGLAVTTDTIDDLGDIAGPPRDAVQPGRRIATLRRELGSSVPLAFLSPRPSREPS